MEQPHVKISYDQDHAIISFQLGTHDFEASGETLSDAFIELAEELAEWDM